jgi:hypothetical protein
MSKIQQVYHESAFYVNDPFLGALCPSKPGLMNKPKHIVYLVLYVHMGIHVYAQKCVRNSYF